ncbi:hypothetical protein U5903_09460 [Cereibacter johrii]|uniref:hypothetical protein n=1 Tax=Cereibacter johrii TaxID=445629 RepID=UPI002B258097|nr:hypothetical protein [Cereibacter johrii]MEA5160995.1 hypothetical protein [Cereibacter johrii]
MFEDVEDRLPGGARVWRRQCRHIPPFLTTDPTADVQVLDPVPPDLIGGALIEDEALAGSVEAQLNRELPAKRPVFTGPFGLTLAHLNGVEELETRRRDRQEEWELWDAVAVGADDEPGYLGDGVWVQPPDPSRL